MTTLVVASAISPLYAPQYVAHRMGYFSDHGLEIELIDYPVSLAGLTGERLAGVDLLVGSLLYADRLARSGAAGEPIAQCVQHAPMVLCHRLDARGVRRPADLSGRTVLMGRFSSPTPWVAWQRLLSRMPSGSGAPPRPIVGYSVPDAIHEFRQGRGDLLYVDQDSASRAGLESQIAVGALAGRIPWSLYLTVREPLDTSVASAFRQALDRALEWLGVADPAQVAEICAGIFPDHGRSELTTLLGRYQTSRTWPRDAPVPDDSVRDWRADLDRAGLL